jgi:hypothetical protein
MEYFFNVNTGRVEQVPVEQNFYPGTNIPIQSLATINAANQFPILPGSSTLPLNAFKNTVAPMSVNTGITASSAAVPFEKDPIAIAQGFTRNTPSDIGTNFQFLPSANEDETDEVEETQSGIAKLFQFLQKFSPSGLATRGLDALGSVLDFSDSPNYRPATIGVYGYTPQELDRMNALGGYYSEPMRAYRRNVNRISNLMRRAAADKSYSQKNLDKLMTQVGMGDVDTGAMIDSIKASSETGYGIGDVGQAATPGRDYSSSPGAMAGDMEYGEE